MPFMPTGGTIIQSTSAGCTPSASNDYTWAPVTTWGRYKESDGTCHVWGQVKLGSPVQGTPVNQRLLVYMGPEPPTPAYGQHSSDNYTDDGSLFGNAVIWHGAGRTETALTWAPTVALNAFMASPTLTFLPAAGDFVNFYLAFPIS